MGVFASGLDFAAIGSSMAASTKLWMNGVIQIVDPNIGDAVWNPYTNTETGGTPTVLWQGPARIQHLKSTYVSTPEVGFSQLGISGIRIQIPLDVSAGFIRSGLQVIVIDGGNDYELEQLSFIITSAINSSYAWLRTLECNVDVKSIANSTWSGIAGTVVNASASPVTGAIVGTFHFEGGIWVSDYDTTTDDFGNYELPADAGVPVAVSVTKSGYVTQFYTNRVSQATADLVTPVNHVETQSIDFTLVSTADVIVTDPVAGDTQLDWVIGNTPINNAWYSVIYAAGLFVAVSTSGTGDRVMTSPDGVNWTSQITPIDNNWASITYGNGLFVAVASTGSGDRVMTSPDGITWTSRTTPVDNSWASVTYGGGLFVAVAYTGSGDQVMTSPDGINWTPSVTPDYGTWYSVTYGAGQFVAVSYDRTGRQVMTSPDGIAWTSHTIPIYNGWSSVTYGAGLFVAVAWDDSGDRVMTSPDGITWTSRISASSNSWSSVTYGAGLFVAVASTGSGDQVMTSIDGITWTSNVTPANKTWSSVTYGAGQFVAVASAGPGDQVMTSIVPIGV